MLNASGCKNFTALERAGFPVWSEVYGRIAKEVAPKRAKLAAAMKSLSQKQAQLHWPSANPLPSPCCRYAASCIARTDPAARLTWHLLHNASREVSKNEINPKKLWFPYPVDAAGT